MHFAPLSLLLLRVFLACVFGVAAGSKLIDRTGTAQAVEGFGMPRGSARYVAVLLPLTEAFLALLLSVGSLYRIGAAATAALLTLFNVAIAVNLLRGRRPECNCFGQVHSSPIGAVTLLRNLGLTTCALVVFFWAPVFGESKAGQDYFSSFPMGSFIGVLMTLSVLVFLGLLAWLVVRLFREHGRLLLRFEALEREIGRAGQAGATSGELLSPGQGLALQAAVAPSFAAPNLSGKMTSLSALRDGGRSVVLIFSNPNCQSCNELVPAIVSWQLQYAEFLTFAIITEGSLEANQKKFAGHALEHVLLQNAREIADLYGATLTPTAISIESSGRLSSTLHAGAQAIVELVAHITGDAALTPGGAHAESRSARAKLMAMSQGRGIVVGAAPGELAPTFRLPNLDGVEVAPLDDRGAYTLLVFWNPGCRFCKDMLPDLKKLEASMVGGPARLLLLSTGTVQANRDLGLRSEILLDPGFSVGRSFGVQGTPAGVLLDRENRIVSSVAIGAQAILRLADSQLNQPA